MTERCLRQARASAAASSRWTNTIPEDARELEFDKTAPAPVAVDRATQDTAPPPPRVLGTADTAIAPTGGGTHVSPALARASRMVFVVVASLAAGWLVYFCARFLVAANPPALHASFVGRASTGAFEPLGIFVGPYLTLVRMLVVASSFLAIATWSVLTFRNEFRVHVIATIAVIAGQFSPAVAVLTSSESLLVPRLVAVVIYVAMPTAAFLIGALFPNGRPVPRWSLWLVPLGVTPACMQAAMMYVDREFSVAMAAVMLALALLLIGLQGYRYRTHATVRERSQIKWLCYAAVAFLTIQAVAVVVLIPLLADRDRAAFPFLRILFELLIAASYLVGLASLLFSGARYRVWDVDRVINRTIVYAIVTVLLAAASGVGYFGLRAVFAEALPPVASIAISIAIVIGLAAPLRRRIARWIDRKFYGIGLDYEALAAKAVRAEHRDLPATGGAFASYDDLVLLGRGGMGAVYRAHNAELGVPVALKVMAPQLAANADAQARFCRESQILDDLRHPNVVPYLASGHEAGLAFIAMQYIDGEDLGALVRRRGKLTLAEAAPLVADIAGALDLAHARGVVHRDIKPANVLVDGGRDDGGVPRALVMDFGVARLADDPRAPDASLVGSLHYIAPEQIHDGDAVDARADIYSLGASAFEMVTGRPPFVESTALGLVLAHLHQPPRDPRVWSPQLPQAAAQAILRALAKDPAERFATAGAFAAELRAAAESARDDRR